MEFVSANFMWIIQDLVKINLLLSFLLYFVKIFYSNNFKLYKNNYY